MRTTDHPQLTDAPKPDSAEQPPSGPEERRAPSRLWQAGRTAWAVLGVLAVLAVVGYAASLLSLIVVPLVLALFPATLLVPVAAWMRRRGVPSALAAIASILAALLLFAALVGAMIPLVAAELPDLADSAEEGIAEIETLLAEDPFGIDLPGIDEVLGTIREQVGEVGDLAAQALDAAVVAFETVTGLIVVLVLLFFYLKDGRRLAQGLIGLAPARMRPRVAASAEGAWATLGAYFRGQLLVALVDAVLIGAGLLVLGVPLAVPLAVLIFFGGLFPIVGAVLTGALAVLVALADGGLTIGLIVLGLVLLVQQLESNVLEPYILGRAIHLHPIVVLLSIATGALLLGILGAFLAVPLAAIIARTARDLRADPPQEDPGGGTAAADEGERDAGPSTDPDERHAHS